jgi:hypothetical protein
VRAAVRPRSESAHDGDEPGAARALEVRRGITRLTYDHAADFHWGSNCLYVLIHRDDLHAQRLDRSVVRLANG